MLQRRKTVRCVREFEQAIYREASCTIVLSNRVRRLVEAAGAKAVHVIPNPVAQVSSRHAPGALRVLCVARVTALKRPDWFAEMAEHVKDAWPSARVEWIGPHAQPAASSRTAPFSKVYLGPRPDPWDEPVSIFAFPSRVEEQPFAVLEAMARGIPVVATDVGDHAELLADCGVVTSKRKKSQFVDAVVDLLGRPVEQQRLGEKSQQRVRRVHGRRTFANDTCAALGLST